MKKLVSSFLFLFILNAVTAQLTSVDQLKDVNPDDEFYFSVRNLVERYGVLGKEEARQGGNYLPAKPLTRRTFAITLAEALDRFQDLFNAATVDKEMKERDSIAKMMMKESFKGYADAAAINITSCTQYKDIKSSDPDYASIERLTDHYKLRLADAGNKFVPGKTITEEDLEKIFNTYFDASGIIFNPSSKTVTRGKWAIYLDALLDRLQDNLADIMSGAK